MEVLFTAAGAVSAVGVLIGLIAFGVQSARHRIHLSRCVDDLQRLMRLERRLAGVVNDMERVLDDLPVQSTSDEVPEELVGQAQYLFALRREAKDHCTRLSRHAVRLRWPDAYSKLTLAGKRCELAHGGLVTAFRTLADAAREYERGTGQALLNCGDGPAGRLPASPVRVLDERGAEEVARLREVFESSVLSVADAARVRLRSDDVFEVAWPVWRSELSSAELDPYGGEVRPMGWSGFGSQPRLNVDAR